MILPSTANNEPEFVTHGFEDSETCNEGTRCRQIACREIKGDRIRAYTVETDSLNYVSARLTGELNCR